MLSLDLIPGRRWLVCRQLDQPYEYEPRGNCHDPLTALIASVSAAAEAAGATAIGATAAEAAGTAAIGATAAETAGTAAALGTGGLYAAGGTAAGEGLSLGTIGSVVGAGGTLLSAKAGLDNADYQSAVARSEAAALKQKANEDAAAAERSQITQDKKTELVQSRLRALAADSGTDATSGDVLATSGRIAQQGEYNAQSALYEGLARSRSDTNQADIDLFKANRIGAAAPLAATGTILSGIGSFADRRLTRRLYSAGGDANFGFGAL